MRFFSIIITTLLCSDVISGDGTQLYFNGDCDGLAQIKGFRWHIEISLQIAALNAKDFRRINFGQNIFEIFFMEFLKLSQKFWRTESHIYNQVWSGNFCLFQFHTNNVNFANDYCGT